MNTSEPILIGVVAIGLLHGLEPGHGWPIALLYSARANRPMAHAFLSSGIISFFHLASSFAVVTAYLFLSSFIGFANSTLKYAAAGVLILLALKYLNEKGMDDSEAQHGHYHNNAQSIEHDHEHEHPGESVHTHMHRHAKRVILSLAGIAAFAFVLGFAHEEEFALLALLVEGINPFYMIGVYASSVTVSLVGVTVVTTRMYKTVEAKLKKYERYIPKISGVTLLVMALISVMNV